MEILNNGILKRLLATGITLLTLSGAQLSASAQAAETPICGEVNKTIFGDLHLPIYLWTKTPADPSAIIVAIHGGCLHGGTYKALGEALAPKNVMVVSMDLRGYGKWYYENFGTKSDKTFHYKQTKEDFAVLVGRLRESYPGVPIYFIGESLGANLSLHMVGKYQHLADGAILCSTYSAPKIFFQPFMVVSALQFLSKPFGKLTMVPYIKARLSDTPEYSLQHLADPMGRDHQTLKEMLQSMWVNQWGKYYATKIPADTSVLMLHGERDKLCAPWASKRLFSKITAHDKTFALIPKRGHLLVETPEMRPEVLAVLETWLDSHSKDHYFQHAYSLPPHRIGQMETKQIRAHNPGAEIKLN